MERITSYNDSSSCPTTKPSNLKKPGKLPSTKKRMVTFAPDTFNPESKKN